MSDYENPYQTPETEIVPQEKQSSGTELTVKMLQYLSEASPWLRFIGILGYIGAGFTVLAGIISASSVSAVASSPAMLGDIGNILGPVILLFYIPAGVIMFFPAHFTYKFGAKIHSYKFSNSIEDLEEALKNNKSFWKFTGIMAIISLALIPAFIIIMIIVAVSAAAGMF